MFPTVDTKDPTAVEFEVQAAYLAMYPQGSRYFVPKAFGWALDCFTGNYGNYQAIDALYHDFEHTLQGTLCLMRLLQGRHQAGVTPTLPQRTFELGMLAILMHDTGYLKTKDDVEGTGAKYTIIHVARSADFAGRFLQEKGFHMEETAAVQHMIRCTGVKVDLKAIPFPDDLERMTGYALGTADLLGQMAADDYVDELPILYLEFDESARFNRGNMTDIGVFCSAEDLMRKTPLFWDNFVQHKINVDFEGLYHFLNQPYPDGPNYYLQRIEANLIRLRERVAFLSSQP